ncbi:transcriptional regulator, TetR family [Rubrobacter xylanophilus DSM 9941]|uniref:Transcriptional regulator, TetR family n=1 Tax=Rubrobacter xylanophilus (strain DSM 9941 / JCM 11954 / NBRC 16129 / PRD-1) TaxID=266117 RepID=Q1AYW4_RUBXD|nr:TetR/AcrR family transcriptional regulator [Rubrobacter xylanophilus]ABG03414.1 transcriptional regulator, TetR family [Rubrobacter xylanophilus DSM 9941]
MGEERDRRDQILEAAFEEFSAKGFRGATIKSIAEAAGLQSPALIYWYFPDKEALFREVLGSRIPVLRAVRDPARLLERPPEEVLPLIARRYLSTFDNPAAQRMARLLVGEATRRPEIAEIFGNAVIKRMLGFLKSYMARQVELGRLRPHDVRSSARAFIGMLLPQVGGKVFFPAIREDGLTDEEHVENAVGMLLEGLRPEGKQGWTP